LQSRQRRGWMPDQVRHDGTMGLITLTLILALSP
jgi:hypothetical protein